MPNQPTKEVTADEIKAKAFHLWDSCFFLPWDSINNAWKFDITKIAAQVCKDESELRQQNTALRRALTFYGKHRQNCAFWEALDKLNCTCGYESALKLVGGK